MRSIHDPIVDELGVSLGMEYLHILALLNTTEPGGVLYENPAGVLGHEVSRLIAWRRLIAKLRRMTHGEADNILAKLGVVRTRHYTNGWRYTLI